MDRYGPKQVELTPMHQSVLQHCVSRWNVYILQKMIHGPSNIKFNYKSLYTV